MARRTQKPRVERLITGQDYGGGKQLRETMQTARAAGAPAPLAARPAPLAPPPPPSDDPFGPTARPHEPVTAGAPIGPGPGPTAPAGMLPEDPNELIRVMFSQTGHPDILDLLAENGGL